MNVLVTTKTNSAHKYHVWLWASSLSDFISWAEFPTRIDIYFQFCFLWCEFRKISLLQNILQYIFTVCNVFLFIFHVTKAHAIFHTILHQKFKLDVAYKKRMRIEKEPFFCA